MALKTNDYYFTGFDESDWNEIQELWKLTGMGQPERDDNPATIIRCNNMGGEFIVLKAQKNNQIIGTSWLSFDGRRILLHHFCIHPDFQRNGLGTYLGKKTIAVIKKKGFQVKLEVHKKNEIARKLYEKLGFFAFTEYDIYMIREVDKL